MLGFAILHGPLNREIFASCRLKREGPQLIKVDVKHICSAERMPFSLAYFGSLGLTLFFAIGVSFHFHYITFLNSNVPCCTLVGTRRRSGLKLILKQVRSTIGTLLAAIVQVVALLSYLAAYFPGGITTLRFGGQMLLRGAGSVLPI